MSPSFTASLSDFPQDFRKVRVAANLGALFECPGVLFPPYNVPRSTLPFPLQRLDVGTPLQLYQTPALYPPTLSNTHTNATVNNLHYPNYVSPSLIPSREATPSSTTSTTPEIYNPHHSHAINYSQTPMQNLNMDEAAIPTQQSLSSREATMSSTTSTTPEVYNALHSQINYFQIPMQNLNTNGVVATQIPSRQATPSSTMNTSPEIYNVLHSHMNYFQMPMQDLNANQVVATQIPSRQATPSNTANTNPEIYNAFHSHPINYFQMPVQNLNTNESAAAQQSLIPSMEATSSNITNATAEIYNANYFQIPMESLNTNEAVAIQQSLIPSTSSSTTDATSEIYNLHSHAVNYFQMPVQDLDTNEVVATQQSLIQSTEATTTSSTTSMTSEIYNALHSHAINYFQMPMQQLNTNGAVATQQAPPVDDGNGQPAAPPKHHTVKNTTTAGPIRGSTSSKRQKPYMRPSAPSSSQLSTSASGHISSSIAQSRMAVQGICKINGCGQTFASADEYPDHVRSFHGVKRGKNGDKEIQCPWDGCGEIKTQASLWNHILGHSTKSACYICHKVLKGLRDDTMQRHIKGCAKKHKSDGLIPLESDGKSGSYTFFCEA